MIGERVSGGVELDVTNEELANAANLTHFTASRLLSAWQRHNVVKKSRGKILLRHPARLFMGDGKLQFNTQREITEIEQVLLDGLLRLILRDLHEAWTFVTPIDFYHREH